MNPFGAKEASTQWPFKSSIDFFSHSRSTCCLISDAGARFNKFCAETNIGYAAAMAIRGAILRLQRGADFIISKTSGEAIATGGCYHQSIRLSILLSIFIVNFAFNILAYMPCDLHAHRTSLPEPQKERRMYRHRKNAPFRRFKDDLVRS